MKTRTGKTLLNMTTSLFEQVVTIICGLIAPRLILSTFGSTYNGVISSATQFLNVINILTLGITAATRVALYVPLANGDTLAISSLMKATKQYMRKVAIGVIVYTAALSAVYPFISNNDLTYTQNAALILIVGIGTFANYLFSISDMTLLQASQSTYIVNIANIIKSVINTACVAVLIKLNCSIYCVKLGSAIVFFVVPVILSLYVKRRFKLTYKCEPNNEGIKGRKATAFHSVANIIHDNVDIVILTFFSDAKEISVYTVYYFVVGKIKSLLSVFTSGMEAAFGDMWAKKEYQNLKKNFRAYEYLLYSFTAVVFSCVGVLILPFVKVYTRGITDINYIIPSLAITITLAEAMYCIRQPYLTLVYATGSFEETKWGAAAEAIINILTSVILVKIFGLVGVIIGTLVANTFRTVQFALFASNKLLHRSVGENVNRFLWLVLTSGMAILCSILILSLFSFEISWLGWILQAVIVFTVSMVSALIMSVVFYKNDLKFFITTIKNVIRKGYRL